jgi:hypothetical protein
MATKTCCVCGRTAHGQQWWNRDKGYGLCLDCAAAWIMKHHDTAEFERSYGKAGVHWGKDNPALARLIVQMSEEARKTPKPTFKNLPPLPQGVGPEFLHLLGITE